MTTTPRRPRPERQPNRATLPGHATLPARPTDHSESSSNKLRNRIFEPFALWHLSGPLPTGGLAQQLGLDRSNVTSVVDRLVARGLITRQAHPPDRRVKLLVLTQAGRAVRQSLDERLFSTVTLFEALTEDEQGMLATLLARILATADVEDPAPIGR